MHFVGGLCYDLNTISYLKTYASVREEDDLTATFLKSSKVRLQRELKEVHTCDIFDKSLLAWLN